jgi:hypothetical protein
MRTHAHALAIAIALVACTAPPASIDRSWRSSAAPELSSVVVVSPSPYPHTRRALEDQMAAQLSRHGVHAVPAYAVFGNTDLSDHDRALAAARAKGFDGLVGIRFIDARDEVDVNGITRRVVRLQINAYSLASGQLVWTGVSTSDRPYEVVSDATRVAGDRLVREGIVGVPQTAMK